MRVSGLLQEAEGYFDVVGNILEEQIEFSAIVSGDDRD